jgi:hypothetical protein
VIIFTAATLRFRRDLAPESRARRKVPAADPSKVPA